MQLASVTRHYRNGGYYPVGGCTSIAKKIFKAIYNYGGRVLVGQAVKEITVYKNQVMGVTMANGDYIKSR
jgi:all-trans-retinol 13,14-reductase